VLLTNGSSRGGLTQMLDLSIGKLSYISLGKTTPTTVVFLHGLFGDKLSWLYCLMPLSKYFRVVAIDLPAHGLSIFDSRLLDWNFFNDWLEQTFIQLGLE